MVKLTTYANCSLSVSTFYLTSILIVIRYANYVVVTEEAATRAMKKLSAAMDVSAFNAKQLLKLRRCGAGGIKSSTLVI
jgi:hypothetical protein